MEIAAMQERDCGMVVIGNEILSGKVHDTNSYFAACELRKIGVTLKRIAVVPDELQPIADEVNYCARNFEFVITSGGVGPTHDDITIEAVARAFGRPLVIHPELERLVRMHFNDRLAIGMRMAQVPEGAVLNAGGDLRFPTVQLENVYILPGIPQIFESKLAALLGRFATDPYYIRTIYISAGESTIAEYLNTCLRSYPALMLGSYPRIGSSEYRVKLTLESKDRQYLERAFDHLIELLPRETVVKVE
jgi:molybdenum cofactor synthesis domain-containing protein